MPYYDVVVVGGGHNGVVAAAVLARHGLRVALVERNYLLGGLAAGHYSYRVPGSRFAYALGLVPEPVARLTGLPGPVEEPDPSWVELGEDGEEVELRWWRSPERLRVELRERGLEGAWMLVSLAAGTWRCMERLGLVYTVQPPSRWDAAAALEKRCGPEAAWLVEKPAYRVLGDYVPRSRWDLLIYPSMLSASGFVLAYYHMNMNVWSLPRGGMMSLSRLLRRLAAGAGVSLYLGATAEELVVKRGEARGVVLSTGERLGARAVLYAAPLPSLPMLRGVDRGVPERELRSLERMASEKWRVMRYDYILRREPAPPREEGWRGTPIYVYWTSRGGGEYTYIRGDGVYRVQASGGIVDPMNPLPPGVEEEGIEAVEERGPWSQERCCRNPTGHPDHIPMRDPWLFDSRPLPGWGDYRTSMPCLYHGSASSYPGGEVSGVPGLNAAARILIDLGVEPRLPGIVLGRGGEPPEKRWGRRC